METILSNPAKTPHIPEIFVSRLAFRPCSIAGRKCNQEDQKAKGKQNLIVWRHNYRVRRGRCDRQIHPSFGDEPMAAEKFRAKHCPCRKTSIDLLNFAS